MRYFVNFPEVVYPLEDRAKTITNISLRFKINDFVRKNAPVYYPYIIKEGETPEVIATAYYGHPRFVWLIYAANDIIDPLFEWPLDYENFSNYIRKKYGSIEEAMTTVHHYENGDGLIVDLLTYNSLLAADRASIDCYSYEHDLNEARRNIKLIDSRYINQIEKELQNIFK